MTPDGTTYIYSRPATDAAGHLVPGKLQVVRDRYGNPTIYRYDPAGKLVEIEDGVGQKTKFLYSGNRVSEIIGPSLQTTKLSYSGKDLFRIMDPDGVSRTFGYDTKGRMKSEVNKLGQMEFDDYDLINGRAIHAVRPDGSSVDVQAWQVYALSDPADTRTRNAPAFAKDIKQANIKASYKTASGKLIKVTINERGQILRESEVDPADIWHEVEFFKRDARGNVIEYVDENGHKTYSVYDERGNKIRYWDDASEIDPATGEPRFTAITYDGKFNRITSITDELGHTTSYIIDGKGNVERRENPDGGVWEYTYYPQGLLKTETNPFGQVTKYEYDARGRLSKVTNPDTTYRVFSYAPDLDSANPGGEIRTLTDELLRVTVSAFDVMGRLVRVVQPEVDYQGLIVKPVIRYTYDANGRLLTVTDAEGHVTTTTHDNEGRLQEQIDHYGKTTEYHYNNKGQLDWMQDALLNKTEYFYDEDRLEVERDAEGGETRYEYDFIALDGSVRNATKPTRIITDYTGPHQATTGYEYDARGRLVLRTNTDNTTFQWGYDGANNLISTIDERGTETRYEYDAMNRRTLVIQDYGIGRSNLATRTYYDALGNVIAVTDARQAVKLTDAQLRQWLSLRTDAPEFTTAYRYDPQTNRRVSLTDPMDNTTAYTYDDVGNLLTVMEPGNRVTQFTYDALNRITSVTLPDPEGDNLGPQSVTRTEYDRVGNVLKQTDALGNITEYEYDALNQRTAAINALGERSETHYDAVGNIDYTLDALLRKTSYHYDKLNRQVEVLAPHPVSAGLQVTILKRSYDTAGNLSWEEDALGNRTEYIEYDLFNRLRKMQDASGAITEYRYDELGNRTQVIDALGRISGVEYDRLNRASRITGPAPGQIDLAPGETVAPGEDAQHDAPVIEYLYDAVGNVRQLTNARLGVTIYTYDASNRRLTATEPDPGGAGPQSTPVTQYFYDEADNLVRVIDARGQVTLYGYDRQDRLVSETGPDPDGPGGPQQQPVTRYFYDQAGNRLRTIDALGRESRIDYDELNRAVAWWTQDIAQPARVQFDSVGRIAWREDELGRRTSFGYDNRDRRIIMTMPNPDSSGLLPAPVERYTYDLQGNLLTRTDARNNSETYGYDALNRRTRATDASGRSTLDTFDAAGNLVQRRMLGSGATGATVEMAFDHDALGRVVRATTRYLDGPGGNIRQDVTYDRYDASGNLVRHIDELGRLTTYVYDALDRLTSVTAPDPDGAAGPLPAATSYRAYDAMGNVVTETDARGKTTAFEYDFLNRLVREIKPKASDRAGEPEPEILYAYDAMGNTIAVTDEEKNTTRYEFNSRDQVKLITDALGGQTVMRYDRVGNLVSREDARGYETRMEYDALDRQVRTIGPDPDGASGAGEAAVTLRAYDANGNLVRLVDARQNPTQYVYDKLNRLIEIIDAKGNSSTRSYDADGNLAQVTDSRGNATRFEYDGLGRQVTIIDALNSKTRQHYDGAGNVVWQQDARLNETSFEYDGLDRLIATISSYRDGTGLLAQAITRREYDANGNLTAVVDPRTYRTVYEYDALNRLTHITDAGNQTVDMAYDRAGRMISRTVGGILTTQYRYDALGRLVEEIDARQQSTLTGYDAVGNIASVTDRRGFVTTREYDGLNRRVKVTDPLGNEAVMAYDRAGNLISSANALQQVTVYEYDELNRLVKTTQPDPDGAGDQVSPVIEYTYDEAGNLKTVKDARGFVTTHYYDALNRRYETENPDGNTRLAEFDEVGNVTSSKDELGRVTKFDYDGLNRLVRQESPDPDGVTGDQLPSVTTFTYDASGNLESATDARLVTTRYQYDALNRRIATIEDFGGSLQRTTSRGYNEVGGVAFTIDANGNRTDYLYDEIHRLVEVKDALQQSILYTYDAAGNMTKAVDASGRKTDFVYDALNRRIRSIDNADAETSWAYDAIGNLKSVTDRLGRTTSYGYDQLNRRIGVTLPDPDGIGPPQAAPSRSFGYDAAGNILWAQDERGFVTRYEYDKLNRQIKVTDPLNGVTANEYDAVGNRIVVTDPLNRTTRFAYDGLNRLIAVAAPDPAGSTDINKALITVYAYDAVGNRVKTTDPLGHETSTGFDALRRRTSETDANLKTTRYEYSAKSELAAVVDAAGNRTAYEYDAVSRMVRQTDALGERSFSYDAAGRLTRTVDALGRITTKAYDALGRNDVETWRDAGDNVVRTITRSFDAEGQVLSVSDADATYTIGYDRLGRVTGIDNAGSPGLPRVVLSYEYDATGNVSQVASTINGTADWTTRYDYDELGRMTGIAQSGGSALAKRVEYGYDAASQLAAIRRFDTAVGATAAATAMTYDADGRLTGIVHAQAGAELARYDYIWDAASRLAGVSSPDGATAFAYDARDQLIGADYSSQAGNPADQSFAWDDNGNPLRPGVTIGSGNRVLEDESATYTYDAEGNRARKTDKATGAYTDYVWDHRNRLVAATDRDSTGNVTAERHFRYDDFGWKIAATVDSDGAGAQAATTTVYVHDRDDIAMVLTPAGAVSELFLHGPGMDSVIAEQRGSELRWMLADHQKSVRDVVNSSGTVLDHVVYDSFGRVVSQTSAGAAPRFGYTGRELDAGLGLMDYRARWYDPALGRFASRDPISFAAGDANLYRYVNNRPMDRIDPTGNQSLATDAADTALNFGEFLWNTVTEVPVSIVVGATYAVGTAVTGLADLAWGIADAGVFATKALASGTSYLQYLATGDNFYRQTSNDLYNETIGKLKGVLNDPCGGFLEKAVRLQKVITPGKGLTERFEDYGREQVRKHLSPRLQKAFDVGTKAGTFVSFFLDPLPVLSKGLGLVSKAVQGVRELKVVQQILSHTRGLEQGMSVGRGAEALNNASHGVQAAKAADAAADAGRGANALRQSEAAAAVARADDAVFAMQAERAQKAVQRDKASAALGDFFNELREKGFAPKTTKLLEEGRGAMPVYTGTANIMANPYVKPTSLLDRAVSSIKQSLLSRFGAHTGATAQQQRIIEAFAQANDLDIAIRSSDILTATVTKAGTRLGLAAKGEATKAKSVFGLLWDNGLKRSDLDLAFVFDRKTGRMLSNNEVLSRVVDPLNRRFIEAGDKQASLMHGAHLSMEAMQGGRVSNAGAAKIGGAGASRVFGRGAPMTMSAGDVAGLGMANRQARIEALTSASARALDPLEVQLDEIAAMNRNVGPVQPIRLFPTGELPINAARQAEIDQVLANADAALAALGHGPATSFGTADTFIGQAGSDLKTMRVANPLGAGLSQSLPVSTESFMENFRAGQAERWAEYNAYRQKANLPTPEQQLAQLNSTGEEILASAQARRNQLLSEAMRNQAGGQYIEFMPFPGMPARKLVGAGIAVSSVLSEDAALGSTARALVLTDEALELWRVAMSSADSLQLGVSIADLPSGELGQAWVTQLDAEGRPSEGRIVLDWNADGHGWFVDPTPLDASEFADPNSAAAGRYDLFTVLAHEVGHTLGFLAGYEGFDRRVTTAADGSLIFAAPGLSVLLSEDGNHLSDTLYADDILADSLALFERKLPSVLSAQLIKLARESGVAPASDAGSDGGVLIGPAHDHGQALPADVVNGAFSIGDPADAGFGWTVGGSASIQNGQGVLIEDSTRNSRLTQSFLIPVGAHSLSFSLIDVDFGNSGSGPQDAFEVALLDAHTMASLHGGMGLANTDALLNIQADGTIYHANGVQLQGISGSSFPSDVTSPITVTISLAGLAAADGVSLYFDLLGFGDLGSRVVIDDVRFMTGAENTAPVANSDIITVEEDGVAAINALANDTDADGNVLAVSVVGMPAHGTLALNTDGTFTYTPDANYFGNDSYTYRVNDGQLDSSLATVSITVTPVNDAPVAADIAISTAEDNAVVIDVLSQASDIDSVALTALLVSGPQHGTVVLNTDGTFSYTPDANYSGADGFSYQINDGSLDSSLATVSIDVTPVNDAPVAADASLTTAEDSAASIDLLVTASDIDSATLTPLIVIGPLHGGLTLDPDGSYRYTPDANYFGSDSFTYRANDGSLDSGLATVSIIVTAMNDAPVAADMQTVTGEDNALVIDVLGQASDIDSTALDSMLVTGPQHGTVALNPDGTFSYTPDANYFGSDNFTYRVKDETLESNLATVSISVTPVNDAPLAVDAMLATTENIAAVINLLAGASDVDSSVLTPVIVDGPLHGVLVLNPDGTCGYTPEANYFGSDSFSYRVSDGALVSNLATVLITVTSASAAPLAMASSVADSEDTARVFGWSDFNVSGSAVSGITVATLPADGRLEYFSGGIWAAVLEGQGIARSDIEAGNFRFVPDANESGFDGYGIPGTGNRKQDYAQFQFAASAGALTGASATMTIDVAPVADAPALAVAKQPAGGEIFRTGWESGPNAIIKSELVAQTQFEGWTLITGPDTYGAGVNGFEVWGNGDKLITPSGTYVYVNAKPGNGTRWLELNNAADAAAYQTLGIQRTVNTIAGMGYQLSLDYAGWLLSSKEYSRIGIYVDGVKLASYANIGGSTKLNWQTLLYKFIGSGGPQTISIVSEATLFNSSGRSAMVDNIALASYRVTDKGDEDMAIRLSAIAAALGDGDGSETLGVSLRGIPAGMVLSDGVNSFAASAGNTSADLGGWNLGNLSLITPANYNGSFDLVVAATASETGGSQASATETINVTVNPVNDAPVAQSATFALNANTSIVIDPRTLVSDVDGDTLTIFPYLPKGGSLVNNGDGTYTYTPYSGVVGTDTLTYIVSDGSLSRSAQIQFLVMDQVSPIVLDMNGDGIHTLALGETAGAFDLLNSGAPVESGWLSSDDAFLAVDSDHNGSIDSRAELFGGEIGQGFARLAAYDSNGDGVVDSRDQRFGELLLWQDANSNHRTDAGELRTLAEAGITSLSTRYEVRPVMQNGNVLLEHGFATADSGQVISMVDAYFSVAPSAGAAAVLSRQRDGGEPATLPSSWRESLADGDRTASIIVHSAPAPGVQRPPEPVADAVLPGFAWSHNPIALRNEDTSAPVVDWSATGRGLPPADDERQDAGGHWLTDFLGADTGHKADLAKLTGLKLKLDTGKIAKPH